MERLANKIAYITGSAGGIGSAAARLFVRNGARVVLTDVDADANSKLERELTAGGFNARALTVDSTNEAEIRRSFEETIAPLGKLDILFNCAGGSTSSDGTVDTISSSFFDEVLRLEVGTVAACSRIAMPYLRAAGGASIINMSSFVVFRGTVGIHAYAAGKGAVTSLTRAMAGAYAKDRIRVNAIAPAAALSERARRRIGEINAKADLTFSWEDYPFAMGDPTDIANIALFLASEESRMITGQTIRADGGLSAY